MASARVSLHARRSCSLTRALIARRGGWAPHAPFALGTSALSTPVVSTPIAGNPSRSFSSGEAGKPADVAEADVSPGELAGQKAAAELQVLGVVGAGQMGSGIAQLGGEWVSHYPLQQVPGSDDPVRNRSAASMAFVVAPPQSLPFPPPLLFPSSPSPFRPSSPLPPLPLPLPHSPQWQPWRACAWWWQTRVWQRWIDAWPASSTPFPTSLPPPPLSPFPPPLPFRLPVPLHAAAMAGMRVVVADTSLAALDRCMAGITHSLGRLVSKGRLDEAAAAATLSRIRTTPELTPLENADFVVEAVAESEAVKRNVIGRLDGIAPHHAVLASNTSSISITRLAAATSRPDQVIGMHFMNPPVIMSLVEVVPGLATSDHTLHLTKGLAHRFGKAVCEARDYPGFIVNRLLMPMINEAFYALLEGVGTAQDIDKGMKLGTNQPMGPLHLADLIGLDTCVAIMRVLHAGLGDAKYRPCPLLVQYVDAGWLGRKSGRGVYEYPTQGEDGGQGGVEGGEKAVRGRQLVGRRGGH
ncbi:unnamed protein product [Closterium sp. Yama58-4]|nr:unnamed protein product [Closterium sp. Yama58-4]